MQTSPLGDPETWLDDHGGALYKYALLHCRDEHRAEELVQETLLAALAGRERYSGEASARTWLIGILKHKIVDEFRRDARQAPLEEAELLEDPCQDECFDQRGHWAVPLADWGDPEQALARGQFLAILQRCLDALPDRLGRLFLLREVLEEETEQICKELAITPTNLWTMLYRARMGLRRCLDRNQVGLAAWGV